MKIVDFHSHIYPDNIAVKGSQSICDFYGFKYRYSGSADALLNEGKKAGISNHVLMPVAIKPEHVAHINEFTASVVASHTEFYGFGTIHADMEDVTSETDRIKRLGLKGIKIHPDTQAFPIDDKRLYPMYEAAAGSLPVMIHCGDPRYEFSRPEKLRRVLDDFPSLQVIGAHLGGWSMFDKAFEYLKDTSCYFDFSSCMMFIGKRETEKYIKRYGADRMLFGTDFPLWSPEKEVKRFLSLDLSDSEKESIAHINAEKLLKCHEAATAPLE